jgi:hypothetical protein
VEAATGTIMNPQYIPSPLSLSIQQFQSIDVGACGFVSFCFDRVVVHSSIIKIVDMRCGDQFELQILLHNCKIFPQAEFVGLVVQKPALDLHGCTLRAPTRSAVVCLDKQRFMSRHIPSRRRVVMVFVLVENVQFTFNILESTISLCPRQCLFGLDGHFWDDTIGYGCH